MPTLHACSWPPRSSPGPRRPRPPAVVPGMQSLDVQLALGRPEHKAKFHNEPGPTWTYRVAGSEDTVFDVDFDADGKVLSISERIDETGGD